MKPDPNEIASAADARNKRLFLQKTHTISQFRPETGIGFFDGSYNPLTKRLDITLKIKYMWVDGFGTYKWDKVMQTEFKNRAKKLIADNWGQQYRLRCMRPGWEDVYADVHFHLHEVISGQHYIYRVVKSSPGETLGGGINGSVGSYMALLSDLVVEETKSMTNKEQIFQYKKGQLTAALTQSGAEMVIFAPNSADLSPAAKQALSQFAKQANQVLTDEVAGLELYIYGATGSNDKTLQTGLGDRRAKAVRDHLKTLVKHPDFINIVSSTLKHRWLGDAVKAVTLRSSVARASTSFEGAALMIHVPKDFKHKQFVESHYIILLHEFGHCLGLPDEYIGIHDSGIANKASLQMLVPSTVSKVMLANPNVDKAGQQKGMSNLLTKANVPSPVFIETSSTGFSTTSVMSAGRDILPAHYLPIWACLATMTGEYVEPEEWKITPVAFAPSNMRHFKT